MKAIRAGQVTEVIIAQDAEERVIDPVIRSERIHGVPVTYVDSREKLGKACGIQVGAAVVAITG